MLKDRLDIEKDSFLEKIKEKNFPFHVGEDYFLSLEDRIRERLEVKEPERKVIIFRSLKAYMGLAASFLLIFGIGFGVLKLTTNIEGEKNLADNIELLENHHDEYIDSIDNFFAVNDIMVSEEELSFVEKEIVIENENDEDFDEYIRQVPTLFTHLIAEELSN